MNYNELFQSVQSAAGLRLRIRLQPLYGQGEVIFPCTVAGGKYQTSKRRIPGYEESVDCTIIDSVQSQANRMEDALLADIRAGNLFIPHVVTSFSGVEGLIKPVGEITCFEAPHRVFDAILRDSIDSSGKHFPFTDEGRAAIDANYRDASGVFSISPCSLLFGSWDSTGVSGGLGEKYKRCVVSELVAVGTEQAVRAGTRIDPLNSAGEVDPAAIMRSTDDEMWRMLAKNRKMKKPSELNHSSVPWTGENEKSKEMHGGITCDYIQQSTTVSLPAIRALGFPADDQARSDRARGVLAAIALHAAALNLERGWHLRSRCDLTLADGEEVVWETIGRNSEPRPVTSDVTRNILLEAISAAKGAGLPWRDQPLRLTPSEALAQLVIKSQAAHRESATVE